MAHEPPHPKHGHARKCTHGTSHAVSLEFGYEGVLVIDAGLAAPDTSNDKRTIVKRGEDARRRVQDVLAKG
jgi:hypothetical protein